MVVSIACTRLRRAGFSKECMTSAPYIELHARSAFSFLEGASLPEALIARCAELKLPAMALLDRNSLSGAVRFHKQAQKSGVRAIIGAEVVAAEGFRYALLAESRQGYQNLCRLLTKIKLRTGHGDQESATATAEDVADHAEGLVCLTGDSEQVERMVQIFGRCNVFVELQRHYDREEEHRN